MKTVCSLLLALLTSLGSAFTEVRADTVLIDFESLPLGVIPPEGYDVGDVHISSPDAAEVIDLGDGAQNQVVAMWPMELVLDLDVPASQVWATIGSNNAPCTVTAYGTLGSDSFSINDPWVPGTHDTITGIGDIYQVTAFGWESWVDDFEYQPVPEADFDGDGDVDGDDFLLWQIGFGTSQSGHLFGDADWDGDTDGDDFLIWQSQFGSGSGSASKAVPEPNASLLLLVALIASLSTVKSYTATLLAIRGKWTFTVRAVFTHARIFSQH